MKIITLGVVFAMIITAGAGASAASDRPWTAANTHGRMGEPPDGPHASGDRLLFAGLTPSDDGGQVGDGGRALAVAASRRPGRRIKAVTLNSALAVEGVASKVYGALAEGEDLRPFISGVMTAFGVTPLGEADVPTADSRLENGFPLLFVPQVSEMADAFTDGGLVSLDSFIAAANAKGARQKGTTDLLTRDYLTQRFVAFAGKGQYQQGQVVPALILALGQERAKRFPPVASDPLWGDGLLDPLQLTLMLYAVSYSSHAPLPTQLPPMLVGAPGSPRVLAAAANPIEEFVKDQIKDQMTGELQDAIEMPLGEREAAQVSVCASLLLYGHKMTVTATPDLIYHRQVDGAAPWSTQVEALLTFEDDYWDNYLAIDRWMLEKLGNCTLPRRGPVEGKPIAWSVSDGLSAHGSFNITPALTGVDGKGVANWQAVVETTPTSRRTFANQRDAVGAAIVRAGSLVPGWSGLERVVGLLKDTGNTGDSPITVMYYVDPCRGELIPAANRPQNVSAAQAGEVCEDSWSGTSSSILTDADPVYRISAQVKWVYDPAPSIGSEVHYYPEGTVSFEVLNSPCLSLSSSHVVTQEEGYLILDLSTSPPSYSVEGISEWLATYIDSCPPGGSFQAPAGGYWAMGEGSTTVDGNSITGTFNDGAQTYTFSFTRN